MNYLALNRLTSGNFTFECAKSFEKKLLKNCWNMFQLSFLKLKVTKTYLNYYESMKVNTDVNPGDEEVLADAEPAVTQAPTDAEPAVIQGLDVAEQAVIQGPEAVIQGLDDAEQAVIEASLVEVDRIYKKYVTHVESHGVGFRKYMEEVHVNLPHSRV